MAKYGSIVTAKGKEKITKAILEGKKVNITEFAAGDGGGQYYQPTEIQTALNGEKWRGAVQECKVNHESPNLIEIIAVIPPNEGGFTIREIGAFDDEGNLIVIANTPDTEKVIITTGAAGEVKLVIYMEISNAEVIELKVDPFTVSATKADLENHDRDPNAHEGQFADKGQFVAHIENEDIHVTPEMKANYDKAFLGLTEHIENEDIHVTKAQKDGWEDAKNKAGKNEQGLLALGIDLSDIKGKIKRLEDGIFNDITGNPFTVSFKNLEGIKLIKGNYNRSKNRIEC